MLFVRYCLLLAAFLSCELLFAISNDAPPVSLTEIVPKNYLNSIYYRIEHVEIRDDFYHYFVDSDYGSFQVGTTAFLLKTLREVNIVSQASNQSSYSNGWQDGELQSQLNIRSESAMDIITSPIGTATNLAGQLANNLGDTLAGNSPYRARGESSFTATEDPVLAMHKRNIASQLGLDVYSNNLLVQNFLNETAIARSAGDVSAGSVMITDRYEDEIAIANGEVDKEIERLIRRSDADDLREYIEILMDRLGVAEQLKKQFIYHAAYSPTLITTITLYLDYLHDVNNLSDFIAQAITAKNSWDAYNYVQLVKMMAFYQESIAKLSSIKMLGDKLTVVTTTGDLVAIFPSDILYLSDSTLNIIDLIDDRRKVNSYKNIHILCYGEITNKVKTALLERDIDFYESFIMQSN